MAITQGPLAAGFELGACAVYPSRNVVTGGDHTIGIEPKIMDVCCLLATRSGEVVSREELIDRVWGVKFGSDESLTRAIYLLRKAIGRAAGEAAAIETVSKRGYRLTVPARPIGATPTAGLGGDIPGSNPSIAVLAFVDMSPTADQGHFSDGVAEEIINSLVPLSGIRVAGRTSSFSFKGANKPIGEIGASLGVDFVLEGSVRKQGDRLRITAQLIDARGDAHLWSHNYHGTVASVFDLQDEIARSVCEELKVIFHIEEGSRRLAPALTANREAYELFLQGRALSVRIFGVSVFEQAEDFFRRALALDPDFAEAWAELGFVYAQMAGYVPAADRRAVLAQSAAAARRAIDLKPDYGLAWAVLSWTPVTQGDIAESLRLAGKACHLSPDNPEALFRRGYYLALIGRVNDAIPLIRKAVELDPIQGRNHMLLSIALLALGDIAGADHHAQLAVGLQYHIASLPAQLAAKAAGNIPLAVERMVAAVETSAARACISEMSTPELWRMIGTVVFGGTDEARAALVARMSAMITEPARRSEIPYLHVLLACGAYAEFFDAFGDRAEPGNHLILCLLWCPFAPQNGLRDQAAWDVYGLPDCRSDRGVVA